MFIPNRQPSSQHHSHQTRDLTARNKIHIALGIGLGFGVAALLACIAYLVYVIRRRWARLEQEKLRTFCEGSQTTKEDTESRIRGISLDIPFSALPARSIMSRISSIRSKRSDTSKHSAAYSSLHHSSSLRSFPSGPTFEIADSNLPPPVPPKPPGLSAQRRDSEVGPLPTFVQRNQTPHSGCPVQSNTICAPKSSAVPPMGWVKISNSTLTSPIADVRRVKSESSSRLERQTDKYSVTDNPKTIRPGHIATCIPPNIRPTYPSAKSTISPACTLRSPTDMTTTTEVVVESSPTPLESSIIPLVAELAPSTPRHPPAQMSLPPHLSSPPLSSPEQEDTPLLRRPKTPALAAGPHPGTAYADGDADTRYSSDEEDTSTFNTSMSLKFKKSECLLPPVLPPLSPQTTFSMSLSTTSSRPTSYYQRPEFGR